MTTWLEPPNLPVPAELERTIGGHPLFLQALVQRGLLDAAAARAFLDPSAYTPASPAELPHLNEAVERLQRAIRRGETIAVWGDFDVDGQTSTALLVSGLRGLGVQVCYHVPVRENESHGVNIPGLQKLVQAGANLILTCDTGISAYEAAEWARQQGIDFLVTDHHDLPEKLPPAATLTNPKFLPQNHPLYTLPGVGVAYKLIEELYQRAGKQDQSESFVDFAALGIIADVAYLQGDARYLAQRGIEALRRGQRLGLRMLLEYAEVNPQILTEEHISFVIAPRLNAVGRLGDANPLVEFLITQDEQFARQMVYDIEGYNEQRKRLTEDVFQGALYQLENDRSLLAESVLVLHNPEWHAGVLGIVASRLVERFGKPAILLSGKNEQGVRGSARSIEGIHITQAINAHAEMLSGFGGHPMAAGLSFPPSADVTEQIARFRKAISHTVQSMSQTQVLEKRLQLFAYLPLDQVNWELAYAMEKLAPFGAGNPPPVFAAPNLKLADIFPVGRLGEHLLASVEDEQGQSFRLIWWQGASSTPPQGVFDLAYRFRASSYNGETQIQLEWVDYRQQEESIDLTSKKTLQVFDFRQVTDALRKLEEIRSLEPELLVWAEAGERQAVQGIDRNELCLAPALVIWTIPPSLSTLQLALQRVKPLTVYLFAQDAHTDEPRQFLERLKGLIKSVIIRYQGQSNWRWLTAATAQTRPVVRLGLEWLAAEGLISFQHLDEEQIVISKANGEKSPQRKTIYENLCRQLSETSAYRTFYRTSSLEALQKQLQPALEENSKG